jgi:hypothetical protein
MAFAFDTLGYAKRLRDKGIPADQAEAHAEATRDFIMVELATKQDWLAVRQDFDGLRQDFDGLRQDFDGLRKDFDGLRQDVVALRHEFKQDMLAMRQDLKRESDLSMDNLKLTMTVRLGMMLVGAIGLVSAIQKLG